MGIAQAVAQIDNYACRGTDKGPTIHSISTLSGPMPHDSSHYLSTTAADDPLFEVCGRLSLRLCDQPQSFSLGVIAHCAGRVKVHRCPLFRSVCGPMRQSVMIRIAGSGKIHPGSTDLLGENEGLGSASAVMIANFSIVEGERDFGSRCQADTP